MKIAFEPFRGGLMVRLLGTLTEMGNADRFRDSVRERLAEKPAFITFDFSEASLPDSRFIGRIVELYHDCKQDLINAYLYCGTNEDVLDIFRIASIEQFIPILTSPENIPHQ